MSKKKLIIFPFNGNAIEALDCINYDEYELVGFVDDDQNKRSREYEVFSRNILSEYKELFVLAVPGSPSSYKQRKEIIASLNVEEDRYVSIIHPRASIGRNVTIGNNCLIMSGVVLTSNAVIGGHVCILPNTVIHHDAVINSYSLIGSNVAIAGGCVVGESCYIGSGSNIMNGVRIGDYSLIGLGSNVIRDVPESSTVAGNPARDLKLHVQ